MSTLPSDTRHASRTSDSDTASGIALCGVTDGRLTRPKQTVNCPNCRVILNHVRKAYPQHAGYTDWRATAKQKREATAAFIADMHGGADD